MISPNTSQLFHPTWRAAAPLLLLMLSLVHLLPSPTTGLSPDGALLLSFKYSVLSDPLSVLGGWNYDDATPCSWNGVMCMGFPATDGTTTTDAFRVISLVLPNAQLLGSVSPDLGLVEHLRHLDLSGNSLNGTVPATLFNASELRILSLAGNEISGELPDVSGSMTSLRVLNLSDNALTGRVPGGVTVLRNLVALSLSNNYLSGDLPAGGFEQLKLLDLSSNLLNGSLPSDLGGANLTYLNLSNNRITGEIPPELGSTIPATTTVDLSFNNLTGEIPASGAFLSQKPQYFAGNPDLCGKLLGILCPVPSTPYNPEPNASTEAPPPSPTSSTSPPAFAVIPKPPDGNGPPGPDDAGGQGQQKRGGLSPAAVVAIIVGDMAGIGLLFFVFFYVYKAKRKRGQQQDKMKKAVIEEAVHSSCETRELGAFSCCLTNKCGCGGEETSETTGSSETDGEEEEERQPSSKFDARHKQQGATLVTLDGDTELEMETLLRASAYILGAPGPSIVYKAVFEDGTALAVRRIGESSGISRLKDFDAQVRSIAKHRHPNLLRVRGFYWAADEKLLICDFAPNGSLANISFTKKLGSSPFHLSWDARLRIARGVARGLAFLHEKKCVHGNLKPSNILLSTDMEPWIADFGLERLVLGSKSGRPGSSARNFGSKRSAFSQSSIPELSPSIVATPSPGGSSTALAPLYLAPESLQNLKPNPKWDVYSFGMVLLELIAGRVFSEAEVSEWNAGFVEEGDRILRMADPVVRGEVHGKEEALLGCFKLGFCCANVDPQRRPLMKEAVQVLDRILYSSR